LEWVSIYAFQCRRLKRFRHNRIIFVGDSAHQVSPFGARGGNGGIQDADNLVWKLALVLEAKASEDLLDSYDEERGLAADENILNSTHATDFMTPKGYGSQLLRDAVLHLAHRFDFAQKMVNSGRLSRPTTLCGCALQTPDVETFQDRLVPGSPCIDAPVTLPTGEDSWLLSHLGRDFCLLVFADEEGTELPEIARAVREAQTLGISLLPVVVCNSINAGINRLDGLRIMCDPRAMARFRYDAQPGTAYLIRPDQHVAARWRQLQATSLIAALLRAVRTKHVTPTHAGG
jgi:3-(3-hydroxy-phenyl)propionate hydroxylase